MMRIKKNTKENFRLNCSDDYRHEINFLYKEQNVSCNLKAYNLALQWLKRINNKTIDITKEYRWSCYYNLGIGLRRLGNYNEAKRYLIKSLEYAENYQSISVRIVLAMTYEDMGLIEKSKETYLCCLSICEEMLQKNKNHCGWLRNKAAVLCNLGKITKDEKYFYDSITIYEQVLNDEIYLNMNFTEQSSYSFMQEKISNNYYYICNIYINKNNIFKAKNIINKIISKTKKDELLNRILKQQNVVGIL